MKQYRWLVALVVGAFLLAACGGLQAEVPGVDVRLSNLGAPTYTEAWGPQFRGTDSEYCRIPDESDPRFETFKDGDGWIHWVFSTKGASTTARLYIGTDVYEPGEPLNANVWHFYTPFMDLDALKDLDPYIELFGGARGLGGGLVISDYCPGKGLSLDVRKTAFAEFEREHEWDIAKKVETEDGLTIGEEKTPKIWLYTDGSGDETATWTVTVTYDGPKDSGFVVNGTIEIENITDPPEPKTVTSIVDDLGISGFEDIALACKDGNGDAFAPPKTDGPSKEINPGETWTCSYSVPVPGAEQGDFGTNTVTVLVESDLNTYGDTDDWEFENPNQPETNKCVTITDTNPGFGEDVVVCVGVDVFVPGNTKVFTYSEDFAFGDDYPECGSFSYPNTATIVETAQYADALLKVNVQCFIWESAWAKGVGEGVAAKAFCDNGFANWGWTNAITNPYDGEWTLYAGAGQCDTDKGTLVGTFSVEYNGGFSFVFSPNPGVTFEGAAVYADTAMFPRLPGRFGGPTTAPGQYYVAAALDGPIHVIAHVNAGVPDPDFGP